MPPQRWTFDHARTRIEFSVRHMLVAKVKGRFKSWTGSIDYDEAAPLRTKLTVALDAASLDSGDATRDREVCGPEFLYAALHAHIVFTSTAVERAGARGYRLSGTLDVRGNAQPLTLDVDDRGGDSQRLRFSARGAFSRKAFGLVWSPVIEAGGIAAGDKVDVLIEAELVPA